MASGKASVHFLALLLSHNYGLEGEAVCWISTD